MKLQIINPAILVIGLLIAGCAAGDTIVEGTVVMRTTTEFRTDVGSAEGIKAGDTLTVWRGERRPVARTIRAGTAQVVRVIDQHHSTIELLSGTLWERDIVQKRSPK
jgi:hypothetical protein